MKTVSHNELYVELYRNYWEPECVINDHPFFGIQLKVEKQKEPILGDMALMTNQELQDWWQNRALVKIEDGGIEVRLYRIVVNKERLIIRMPKVIYKLKDYKTATSLAKQIVKDLYPFFGITAEF